MTKGVRSINPKDILGAAITAWRDEHRSEQPDHEHAFTAWCQTATGAWHQQRTETSRSQR
jgi:hypothetical protein